MRICRSCGCTEESPCAVDISIVGMPVWIPCAWVEEDLCSGCVEGVTSIPHDQIDAEPATVGGGSR
jgi:hypothetical protein